MSSAGMPATITRLALTWRSGKMHPQAEKFNGVDRSSPSPSCPDCIIGMCGYDFGRDRMRCFLPPAPSAFASRLLAVVVRFQVDCSASQQITDQACNHLSLGVF